MRFCNSETSVSGGRIERDRCQVGGVQHYPPVFARDSSRSGPQDFTRRREFVQHRGRVVGNSARQDQRFESGRRESERRQVDRLPLQHRRFLAACRPRAANWEGIARASRC